MSGLVPVQIREYRPSFSFSVCAITLLSSLLLGGGTRGGFLSDAILELLAVPALLISLSSFIDLRVWQTNTRRDLNRVLGFCSAIALVPLVQLVPLPPWVWVGPLHREQLAKIFELLGAQAPWLPISISPHATWLSFLSLLPPMAIFITAVQLNYRERRELSLLIIAVGVVSVFVGLTQVAQGPSSWLRFFTITNDTEAVGFFANRNHFAALLYTILLFAAVWAIDLGFKMGSWKNVQTFETATVLALTTIFMVFIVVIAGAAMARSRAGLALSIAALVAVFTLAVTDRRNASGVRPSKLLLVATVLALILSVQFALYRILERFATDPLEDARTTFARNTIQAAKAFMPFGSGMGTFVPVYQMFERPADSIANTYANHAHNDFLELWLETGIVGPILLILFVVWLGFTMVRLWRWPPAGMGGLDCSLARAATVVIALLMAHSFVDYPMRTEAIMAIFAVSCAFLIEPVRGEKHRSLLATSAARGEVREAEQRSVPAKLTVSPSSTAEPPTVRREPAGSPPQPQGSLRRWGAEIEWPEEWQKSGDQADAGADKPKTDTKTASKSDAET